MSANILYSMRVYAQNFYSIFAWDAFDTADSGSMKDARPISNDLTHHRILCGLMIQHLTIKWGVAGVISSCLPLFRT